MRVAFYAPLKSPRHPVVSGDREVARLLVRALALAGHDVWLAPGLRSHDPRGDRRRQQRLQSLGAALAARVIRRLGALAPERRPAAWITYHPYHKSPDWIGPPVCDALGIPWIAVEASHAPKQAEGPWHEGHVATARALESAAAVVSLSSDDLVCLQPLVDARRLHRLFPFVDVHALRCPLPRSHLRRRLAREQGLDAGATWVLAVAMMRPGAKSRSYRILADAARGLPARRCELVVLGDGEAAGQVRRWLRNAVGPRVRFAGEVAREPLAAWLAAADLLAWPAVEEAYGMALLEAQGAGLAVVAGADHGVPDVVQHGVGGLLTPPGNARAFATALAALADNPAARNRMGAAARLRVRARHDLRAASRSLDAVLRAAMEAGR